MLVLKYRSKLVVAAAVLAWNSVMAFGEEAPDHTATLSVIEENDSIGSSSDKHYTQGARLSLASGATTEGKLVSITDGILLAHKSALQATTYRSSVFFGQSIFTPENLSLVVPDKRDRPYAGWLYLGAAFYRESSGILDQAEITVGLVGPGAEGQVVQENWHHISRRYLGAGETARGWGAQLSSEPGIVLMQTRKWRIPGNFAMLETDAIPEIGASIGNIFTYAAVGGLIRMGQRISGDWGPPRVQPALSGPDFIAPAGLDGRYYGWYVFAGTQARLMARNIFLDGNSFTPSASVQKKPLVADFTFGFSAVFPVGRATVSYVRRTPEFRAQTAPDDLLSFAMSFLF